VVAIFGADHVYRMNIREMIEFHEAKRAAATVAAIPVPREQALEFGVIETESDGRIVGFHEKRPDAPAMPGDPTRAYVSMGNYIFSTRALLQELHQDANNEHSTHDFGRDILPSMVGRAPIYAYDFQTNSIPGEPAGRQAYWRDVGSIDAYYEAQMDVRAVEPELNLYNREWPLITAAIRIRPPSSSSTKRAAAGRPSTRWSPAAPSSPAVPRGTPCWDATCASTPARWWKTPSFSTTATSGGGRASAGPSWTRTCACPKTP